MRPSQVAARSSTHRRPRMDSPPPAADVELECPHCMLPVDSLDEPCPFCGRVPRFGGKDVLVIDDGPTSPAPWGVQTVAVIDRVFAIFVWLWSLVFLIPFVSTADPTFLMISAIGASIGSLAWKVGGGLQKAKNWARTTQNVLAALLLFWLPFSPAISLVGFLSLWGTNTEAANNYFANRPQLPER